MPRKRKFNPETLKLRKSIQGKVRRYNIGLRNKGITDEFQLKIDWNSVTTKKQLNKIAKELEKRKKDKLVKTRGGLVITQSELTRIEKAKTDANRRLRRLAEKRQRRREQIAEKWGKPKESATPTTKASSKVPQYTRSPEDFKSYKELLKFEGRLNKAGTRGAEGQDLKDRILNAIRGETFVQANGFKFRGGSDNPLAKFIEEQLTPDEVEFFFGGKLNFEFIYSPTDGMIKEFQIVDEIVNNPEYPILAAKWEDGYKEEWAEYMAYNLINDTTMEDYEDEEQYYNALIDYIKNT